jgi:hypothetical protein
MVVVAGLLFFIPGAVLLAHTCVSAAGYEPATGEVIALDDVEREHGQATVVEFEAEGQRHRVELGGGRITSYELGERVQLGYPKGRPSAARSVAFWDLYLFPLVLIGFGLLFLLPIGALYWWPRQRTRLPQARVHEERR